MINNDEEFTWPLAASLTTVWRTRGWKMVVKDVTRDSTMALKRATLAPRVNDHR